MSVESTEDTKAPRMSKRERRVAEDTKSYLRATRRVQAQTRERNLAKAAQDRASARLEAAQEKLDRYSQDQEDAADMLRAMNVELPELPEDDGTEDADAEPVTETQPELEDVDA